MTMYRLRHFWYTDFPFGDTKMIICKTLTCWNTLLPKTHFSQFPKYYQTAGEQQHINLITVPHSSTLTVSREQESCDSSGWTFLLLLLSSTCLVLLPSHGATSLLQSRKKDAVLSLDCECFQFFRHFRLPFLHI